MGIYYGGMAALSIAQGHFTADIIRQQADLNKDIAEMNAEFAELDAYNAEIEGYSQVAQYQKIVDQTVSKQRAELAAADVDTSFGTASSFEAETKFIAEMNRMEIQKQAYEKAMGYRSQARDYRLAGFLGRAKAEMEASTAEFEGNVGGIRSIASGYNYVSGGGQSIE